MKHLTPDEYETFAIDSIDAICDEKPQVHALEFHFAFAGRTAICACGFLPHIQKEWQSKYKIGQSPCSAGIPPEVDK